MKTLEVPQRSASWHERRWPVRLALWLLTALLGSAMVVSAASPASALVPYGQTLPRVAASGAAVSEVTAGASFRTVGSAVFRSCTKGACSVGGPIAAIIGTGVVMLVDYNTNFVSELWNRPKAWLKNFTPGQLASSASFATAPSFDAYCAAGDLVTRAYWTGPRGPNYSQWEIHEVDHYLSSDANDGARWKGVNRRLNLGGWDGQPITGWAVYCGPIDDTNVIYSTPGAPVDSLQPAPRRTDQPVSDPDRVATTRGQCVSPTGQVTDATPVSTAPYKIAAKTGSGITLESLTCPAGTTPGSISVTECVPSRPEVACTVLFSTPRVETTVGGTDPADPCGPAGGFACTLDVWKKVPDGRLQCGSQVACPSPTITPRPQDPSTGTDPEGGEYECLRASSTIWEAVPFERCAPLVGDSPTTDAPPTPSDPGTKNPPRTIPPPYTAPETPPRPYPSPNPNPPGYNPEPTPEPTTPPTSEPTPSPSTEPSTPPTTGPTPPPNVGDPPFSLDPEGPPEISNPSKCAPSGWSILNPAAYVYGMGCVLTWAFVPKDLGPIRDVIFTVPQKPPFSIVISGFSTVTSVFTGFKAGCTTGVGLDFSTVEGSSLRLPCSPPRPDLYSAIYVVMQGVVWLAVGYSVWRYAEGAFNA